MPTKKEVQASLEALGILSGQLELEDCKALGTEPQTAKRTPGRESMLVNAIMKELGKFGAVYRMNAGQIKLDNGRMFRGLPAGFSDIMLIMDGGRVNFIEAKIKPNKATEAQLKFIEKMKRLGCRAGVAYSVSDALGICELERP